MRGRWQRTGENLLTATCIPLYSMGSRLLEYVHMSRYGPPSLVQALIQ